MLVNVEDTNRREYLKRRSAQHALLPELNNLTFFRGLWLRAICSNSVPVLGVKGISLASLVFIISSSSSSSSYFPSCKNITNLVLSLFLSAPPIHHPVQKGDERTH